MSRFAAALRIAVCMQLSTARAVTLGWGTVLFAAPACSLIGPTCVGRQDRGTVVALEGEVDAGAMTAHRVRYDAAGSQNDVQLRTDGPTGREGLRAYATYADCLDFTPAAAGATGSCAVLAAGGALDGPFVTTLVITHGRGNPELLGTLPAYVLWVVGDPAHRTRYTLDITWFRGPDC